MNSTIQTLAEICGTHRFQEKLLFVPSYSVGHQIGEHLARVGTPWVNLSVTTTAGYADELVALELNASGIRLIDFHERLLIIEKLYRETPSSPKEQVATLKKRLGFQGFPEVLVTLSTK